MYIDRSNAIITSAKIDMHMKWNQTFHFLIYLFVVYAFVYKTIKWKEVKGKRTDKANKS